MSCTQDRLIGRRGLLKGGASLALWGMLPGTAIAGTRDPRLLIVFLRGGLDGLSLVAPVGDPDYVRIRQGLALTKEGPAAGLPLDGMFVLNPSMPYLHSLYKKGEALAVHAVASPYRGRSHFDGQDVLETGLPGVARPEEGWLNRALGAVSAAHGTLGRADPRGLAMGAVVPLMMRGGAPVLSWIPKVNGVQLQASTNMRLADLYNHTDPALAKVLAEGLELDKVGNMMAAASPKPAPLAPGEKPAPKPFRDFIDTAETAARFMSSADGPRIGALSYYGWDTHANEGVVQGQLANRLQGLDAGIKAYAEGMGPAWKDTVAIIVTEFGRTAHVNGTDGTDHGTATVALLIGGAVKGGRVMTKWPGLADKSLFEARDLAPTADLRGIFKGVLRDHLGLDPKVLTTTVFPESVTAEIAAGIVAG